MGTLIILGLLLALILVGGWWFFFYETRGGLREKALGLAAMGKAMDAKALVRDQLDLSPEDPQILHLMSKIYGMEGDLLNEAAYLEKVVQIGKYDRELTATLVTARLANIYYQKDMYEEAFFYYLDALDHDPRNMEALVRLAFLCIGQREFELAEKFMRQVPDDQVKFSSYFIGRGVVATMLDRMSEVDYFQKAYEMDPDSTVATFLYAMSLFKQRKFQEALDIANSLVDLMHDDGIRYTLFQFIMVLNLCQSDYIAAMINAKLCIEIARRNEWKEENAES
ncbi:MAG TPA: tetratricopeptide repeat protein, partial [Leptospiraceae bacterium]|nr:tetratricopeptide repeat protein [Leptospiraceae bacterium]